MEEEKKEEVTIDLTTSKMSLKERKRAMALDELSNQEIVVTYESKKGKLHENTRDINVNGVTLTFHSRPLIEDTEVVINYGNRYALIGPSGCGKVRTALATYTLRLSVDCLASFYKCDL